MDAHWPQLSYALTERCASPGRQDELKRIRHRTGRVRRPHRNDLARLEGTLRGLEGGAFAALASYNRRFDPDPATTTQSRKSGSAGRTRTPSCSSGTPTGTTTPSCNSRRAVGRGEPGPAWPIVALPIVALPIVALPIVALLYPGKAGDWSIADRPRRLTL